MEAVFMLLGAITGTPIVLQSAAPSWVPHRKPSQSTMLESKTRPGSTAALGFTWPAPWRKIRLAVLTGSSTSKAVVIMADLIAMGDHDGFSSLNSAAMPAMCGLDIE